MGLSNWCTASSGENLERSGLNHTRSDSEGKLNIFILYILDTFLAGKAAVSSEESEALKLMLGMQGICNQSCQPAELLARAVTTNAQDCPSHITPDLTRLHTFSRLYLRIAQITEPLSLYCLCLEATCHVVLIIETTLNDILPNRCVLGFLCLPKFIPPVFPLYFSCIGSFTASSGQVMASESAPAMQEICRAYSNPLQDTH